MAIRDAMLTLDALDKAHDLMDDGVPWRDALAALRADGWRFNEISYARWHAYMTRKILHDLRDERRTIGQATEFHQ